MLVHQRVVGMSIINYPILGGTSMALETAHIFLVEPSEPSEAATETPSHRNLVKP
jgi:hypothetical protein